MIARRMRRQECPDSPTIVKQRMKVPLEVMSSSLLKRNLLKQEYSLQ
jgi:hypothetical protein